VWLDDQRVVFAAETGLFGWNGSAIFPFGNECGEHEAAITNLVCSPTLPTPDGGPERYVATTEESNPEKVYRWIVGESSAQIEYRLSAQREVNSLNFFQTTSMLLAGCWGTKVVSLDVADGGGPVGVFTAHPDADKVISVSSFEYDRAIMTASGNEITLWGIEDTGARVTYDGASIAAGELVPKSAGTYRRSGGVFDYAVLWSGLVLWSNKSEFFHPDCISSCSIPA
jgi:hypothetical protein